MSAASRLPAASGEPLEDERSAPRPAARGGVAAPWEAAVRALRTAGSETAGTVEGLLEGGRRAAAAGAGAGAEAAAALTSSRRALGEVARALLTPGGLAGAAVEALWISTHLAIYPWGLVEGRSRGAGPGYRIEHLPPVQRGLVVGDVEAAGTPIVLVHGIVDNRSVFTLLRRGLRRRGFGRVTTMNYSILTGDVRVAAARLAQEVEAICEETGYERLHVVGHSMGGLIARYYVTRLGGDARVHTLVTLGSPHAGTWTAYGWPSSLTRQLRPHSALMRELSAPVADCRTRFVCFWSDLDQVMFPQRTAALEHPDLDVTNIRLHGVGHTSIPIMDAVVHGISEALAHLDEHGGTVAPGVVPLRSSRSPRRPS